MLVRFNHRVHLGNRIFEKGKTYDVDKQTIDACYPCCDTILPVEPEHKRTPVCFNIDKRTIYPIDGYGRLNRFLDYALLPDASSSYLLVCSTPYIFGVLPEWAIKGKKVILLTMFEGTPLPRHWIRPLQMAHAIITPSSFCQRLYRKEKALANIPVFMVPLYTEHFENLKTEPTKTFYFGMENAFIEGKQKGWDLIIKAFEELNLKNAKLILKSRHSHYAYNDKEWMARAKANPNIEIILADYTDREMITNFYSRLDCFVFPSRGEGFGLPPLQAMGFGIPTILTNGHGMKDFAKYGIPVRVKHRKYPSYYVNRVLDSTGDIHWMEPDFDDLKAKMRWVYDNRRLEKMQAVKNIGLIKKRYSPEAFIAGLNKAVTSLQKNNGTIA